MKSVKVQLPSSQGELESRAVLMLTGGQGSKAGDTDPRLLPVHVNKSALEAAARGTEHLQHIPTMSLQKMSTSYKHLPTLWRTQSIVHVSTMDPLVGGRGNGIPTFFSKLVPVFLHRQRFPALCSPPGEIQQQQQQPGDFPVQRQHWKATLDRDEWAARGTCGWLQNPGSNNRWRKQIYQDCTCWITAIASKR